MMNAGRDTEGLWHMMDIAVVFVFFISLYRKWYTYSSSLNRLSALSSLSIIPWTAPFLKALPGAGSALKKFQRIAATYATQRVAGGSQHRDLWYYLVSSSLQSFPHHHPKLERPPNLTFNQTGEGSDESSRSKSLHDVTADAFTAVIAGSDTVATSLSHFWYLMMRHPECCERLYEEVDKTFPRGELPYDFARLAEMPYLNACM